MTDEARVQAIQARVDAYERDAEWRSRWHTRLGRGLTETEGRFYERIEQTLSAHHAALDTLRQERDKLAGDLLEEESQHHWTRDYLKAAEAECATLRAQLAVVSSEPQTS